MKNSAETKTDSNDKQSEKLKPNKSKVSLFSIDEHRLSIGLLALVLLVGAGYGAWIIMAPFLPDSTAGKTISRKALADAHIQAEEWEKAIPLYREMLQDDPDNGLAIQKIALIKEIQLSAKWKQLKDIRNATDNSEPSNEILNEESQLFESVISRWHELCDHARYQRSAYQHLAVLHSYRSIRIGDTEEIDIAISVLKEMLGKGLVTSNGIDRTSAFRILKDHPDFERLVREEKRKPNFPPKGFFMPYQRF